MKKTISLIGLFLLLYVVVVNLASLAIYYVVQAAYRLFSGAGMTGTAELVLYFLQGGGLIFFVLFVNALTQYFIGMPLTVFFLKKAIPAPVPAGETDRPADEPVQVRFSSAISVLSIIFFLMITGSILGNTLASVIEDLTGKQLSNLPVELLVSGTLPMTIIFVVLIAGIAEELFFRKFLIDLVRPWGRRGAVVLSAVCFALFHQNLYQFFYTLFLGLVFGLVYEKTRRIRYTILLHIVVNLTGGILLPYASGAVMEWEEEMLSGTGAASLSPEMLFSLLFLLVFFLLVLLGLGMTVYSVARGKAALAESPDTAPYPEFRRAFFTAPGMILFMIASIGLAAYNLIG